MKVNLQTEKPLTNDGAKAGTGKTLDEWYAELDARGGIAKGRRDISVYLAQEKKVDPWWAATLVTEYERARGVVEKDGRPKGYNLCFTKSISAPVEAVYAAWVSPQAMEPWFGPIKMTQEVGGQFSDPDGHSGEFKRIRENKDLRFTWVGPAGESLVDVTVTDSGKGKTGILVNYDRVQTRAEADGLRQAWTIALDALKKHLERGS